MQICSDSHKIHRHGHGRRSLCRPVALFAAILFCALIAPLPAHAQAKKPYDRQLLRLSEILGNIHYLRELCGANDGQLWRKTMEELIKAEGSSAQRALLLTKKFNFGYRSYGRTYNKCTTSAQTATSRLIDEGAALSDNMVRKIN